MMEHIGLAYPMQVISSGSLVTFSNWVLTPKSLKALLCMALDSLKNDEDTVYKDAGKYALCTFTDRNGGEVLPASFFNIIDTHCQEYRGQFLRWFFCKTKPTDTARGSNQCAALLVTNVLRFVRAGF